MFRKKLLAMGLIITIVLCGLSGCTGNTTTAPQETTIPEVTSAQEETSTDEEATTEKSTAEEETVGGVMGYVDAEDICKHISINGKVVEFPWTLNELGEEYTFSENPTVNLEEKEAGAYLLYKGERIALIQAKIDTELDRNSQIYMLIPSGTSNIFLYDIDKYSKSEDIILRYGIPTSLNENEFLTEYYYETDKIYLNYEFYSNSGVLSSWSISLKERYLNDKQEGEN